MLGRLKFQHFHKLPFGQFPQARSGNPHDLRAPNTPPTRLGDSATPSGSGSPPHHGAPSSHPRSPPPFISPNRQYEYNFTYSSITTTTATYHNVYNSVFSRLRPHTVPPSARFMRQCAPIPPSARSTRSGALLLLLHAYDLAPARPLPPSSTTLARVLLLLLPQAAPSFHDSHFPSHSTALLHIKLHIKRLSRAVAPFQLAWGIAPINAATIFRRLTPAAAGALPDRALDVSSASGMSDLGYLGVPPYRSYAQGFRYLTFPPPSATGISRSPGAPASVCALVQRLQDASTPSLTGFSIRLVVKPYVVPCRSSVPTHHSHRRLNLLQAQALLPSSSLSANALFLPDTTKPSFV
ncbi:hypothetical protein EV122DRAFT_284918 [Schizophyllum commune]